MSSFGIAFSVILLLGVVSITSAFPMPDYERFRTHGAQAVGPLHEAREQQSLQAVRENWRGVALQQWPWTYNSYIEKDEEDEHSKEEEETDETREETGDTREGTGNAMRLQGVLPTKSVVAALYNRRGDARIEQDCEADYEECEAAGVVPVRQCIQTYYRCIGIDFQ